MNDTRAVALITGASRGLGLAVARLYAGHGFRLVLTARGADALSRAATDLAQHTDVLALPGDVADRRHIEALVSQALERFGRIDVLINNASELGPSPLLELEHHPLDALEDVYRVNVFAPLHLIQCVLPGMRERGDGLIVNVSSDAAVEPYPTWGGYGSSKAALDHLSRVLAVELDGTGIRVYSVDPGDMNTEMHRLAEPGEDLSHLPDAESVAPAFLALLAESRAAGRFSASDVLAREAEHARA
jgi:NAD(P)-dependent dehydrogenase (short-subunit alcohol dehydrogenase family)